MLANSNRTEQMEEPPNKMRGRVGKGKCCCCMNSKKSVPEDHEFFHFPLNENRRKQWVAATGVQEYLEKYHWSNPYGNPFSFLRVCQDHFLPDDINTKRGGRKLLDGYAIPRLFTNIKICVNTAPDDPTSSLSVEDKADVPEIELKIGEQEFVVPEVLTNQMTSEKVFTNALPDEIREDGVKMTSSSEPRAIIKNTAHGTKIYIKGLEAQQKFSTEDLESFKHQLMEQLHTARDSSTLPTHFTLQRKSTLKLVGSKGLLISAPQSPGNKAGTAEMKSKKNQDDKEEAREGATPTRTLRGSPQTSMQMSSEEFLREMLSESDEEDPGAPKSPANNSFQGFHQSDFASCDRSDLSGIKLKQVASALKCVESPNEKVSGKLEQDYPLRFTRVFSMATTPVAEKSCQIVKSATETSSKSAIATNHLLKISPQLTETKKAEDTRTKKRDLNSETESNNAKQPKLSCCKCDELETKLTKMEAKNAELSSKIDYCVGLNLKLGDKITEMEKSNKAQIAPVAAAASTTLTKPAVPLTSSNNLRRIPITFTIEVNIPNDLDTSN